MTAAARAPGLTWEPVEAGTQATWKMKFTICCVPGDSWNIGTVAPIKGWRASQAYYYDFVPFPATGFRTRFLKNHLALTLTIP